MSETITIKNNNKKENIKDLSGLSQKIGHSMNAAQTNREILLDILDILEKLNDRLRDIDLNHREIYRWVKRQTQEETTPLKSGWFV